MNSKSVAQLISCVSALTLSTMIYATTESNNYANKNLITHVTSQSSDANITANIKSNLAKDKIISGNAIQMSTQNGVVTLSGKVNTETEASRVVEVAQSTAGVKEINTNDLKIKESNQPMADAFITAKVKGSFIREKLFGDQDLSMTAITVETNNGVVYLTGIVDTEKQKNTAIDIATAIDGVKQVQSKLEVKQKT